MNEIDCWPILLAVDLPFWLLTYPFDFWPILLTVDLHAWLLTYTLLTYILWLWTYPLTVDLYSFDCWHRPFRVFDCWPTILTVDLPLLLLTYHFDCWPTLLSVGRVGRCCCRAVACPRLGCRKLHRHCRVACAAVIYFRCRGAPRGGHRRTGSVQADITALLSKINK